MKFKFKRSQDEKTQLNYLIEELIGIPFKQYNSGECVLYEARNNVTTLQNNIINKLESNRRIDLRGLNINDLEDVAILGKLCRDTRYETTRWLYIKDGEIVGSDTSTLKLPSLSTVKLKFNSYDDGDSVIRTIYHINNKIERLNADEVVLLHNHPSGEVTPSKGDIEALRTFKKQIPLLVDGFIVGHNSIYSITKGTDIKFDDTEILKQDAIGKNGKITYNDIIERARKFSIDDDTSILIYANAKSNVLEVNQIKNNEFNDVVSLGKYLANEKRKLGATFLFIYTEDEEVIKSASVIEPFNTNIVTDVIWHDKKHNQFNTLLRDGPSIDRSKYNTFGKEKNYQRPLKG